MIELVNRAFHLSCFLMIAGVALFCSQPHPESEKKEESTDEDAGQQGNTDTEQGTTDPAFELLGIYPGWGGAYPDPNVCEGVDNYLDFESALGREMRYVDVNIGDVSWPDFAGAAGSVITSANGVIRKLDRTVPALILPLGVKELITEGDTYYHANDPVGVELRKRMFQEIAAGKYDQYYEQVARNLLTYESEDAIMRLGHEFDLDSYPWSVVGGNHRAYAEAFRHVVTVMRKSLPELRFCFNWTGCAHRENPDAPGQTFAESAWPGDDVVDVIGIDVYDSAPWTEREMQLGYAEEMAVSKNIPLAIPEWGLWHHHIYAGKPPDEDNPAFVQNMYDYMNALPKRGGGRLMFHCYFQQLDDHDIFSFPESAELFLRLFGSVVDSK